MASDRAGGKEKKKKARDKLVKVVIRRLPPYMTWEQLSEQLDPLPSTHFVSFVPADLSFYPHAFSRCYFAFDDENVAIEFSNKFNRYVFVDQKGNESAAIVELALFHRVPRKRREDVQKDPRCGQVEQEVEYLRFVDELESSRNFAVMTLEEQLRNVSIRETCTKAGAIQETPLTQYMMKLAEQKGRKLEEKLKVLDEKRRKTKERTDFKEKREHERQDVKDQREDRQEEKRERPPRAEKSSNVRCFTNSTLSNRSRFHDPKTTSDQSADAVFQKLGIDRNREFNGEANNGGGGRSDTKKVSPPGRPPRKERGPRPPRPDRPPKEVEDRKKKDRPEREIYRPGQRSRARAAELAAKNGTPQ